MHTNETNWSLNKFAYKPTSNKPRQEIWHFDLFVYLLESSSKTVKGNKNCLKKDLKQVLMEVMKSRIRYFTYFFFFLTFLHVSKSLSFFPVWILMYQIWETSSNKIKNILFQKLFWPFTVQINCSKQTKSFSLEMQRFSQPLEQFFSQ